MTEEQKEQIIKLRNKGYGYMRIAEALGISVNTIKSFCRRNNLTSKYIGKEQEEQKINEDGEYLCLNCGVIVRQNPGRKTKKFCSDSCRMEWWNNNLDKVNRKAVYEFVCPHCKGNFSVYGNSKRKYCSHECYVFDRFGGDHDE